MAFLPNLFLANINAKDGLAKSNRFQVMLPIPPYIGKYVSSSLIESILNLPNSIVDDISNIFNGSANKDPNTVSSDTSITRYLSLQCESAELPGKSLITSDVKIYGPTFKVPYQTQYNEITFTFICTNEFYERKLFERWIEAIMPTDSNNLRYAKDEETRYLTNPSIVQYDDFIRQIYAVKLIDAFPISVAAQPLNWGDENFHRLSVQFAYQRYEPIYTGNYDVVAAASELLGNTIAEKLIGPLNNRISGTISKIF